MMKLIMAKKSQQTQIVKVDEKQRDQMVNNILNAHPELRLDEFKKHQLVELVTAYLLDCDGFNKKHVNLKRKKKREKFSHPRNCQLNIWVSPRESRKMNPHKNHKTILYLAMMV